MSDWGTKAFAAKPRTRQERAKDAGIDSITLRELEREHDYEVCYAHFSELPCSICAVEDAG